MKTIKEYILESGKWYLDANEVMEQLSKVDPKKPAKFIYGAWELYPNYDVDEIGVTDMFPYNESTWFIELITDEKHPKMPAQETINYDFKNEPIKDVVCVGSKWSNGNGVYNASKKKFRITSISEDENYVVFIIDFKKP